MLHRIGSSTPLAVDTSASDFTFEVIVYDLSRRTDPPSCVFRLILDLALVNFGIPILLTQPTLYGARAILSNPSGSVSSRFP